MNEARILEVREYGSFTSFKEASEKLSIKINEFEFLLKKAVTGLTLKYPKEEFIETQGINSFRFKKIAGIIALKPNVRIEIIPKFLSERSQKWRDDFLHIALLTRFANLIEDFRIPTKPSYKEDLYEIIAETWMNLFEANSRGLIRTYINTSWTDYYIDGEVEEEDLLFPTTEGFIQQGLRLSRANNTNQLLRSAGNHLRFRISHPRNIIRLDRAISILDEALKEPHPKRHRSINLKRNPRWIPLIDLSISILSSLSFGFSEIGSSILPGYVILTEKAWEKIIFLALKRGLPQFQISKVPYRLGLRTNKYGSIPIKSTPDVSIKENDVLKLIFDAKYITVDDVMKKSGNTIVSSSDIYEALAFMSAANSKRILLIYPSMKDIEANLTVDQPIEKIVCDGKEIFAYSVGIENISRKNGFLTLSKNISTLFFEYTLTNSL